MNAKRRISRVKQLLEQIGLEPERLNMYNLSSAMAGSFVSAAEEMTETVRALGPNPLRKTE